MFVFDLEEFRGQYPAFSEDKLSDDVMNRLFEMLKGLLADDSGAFPYPESKEKAIIYAALCHLATLELDDANAPGRVTSASQGSVSVSYENLQLHGGDFAQWWGLTKCGALFWALTQPYRAGARLYTRRRFHPYG